MPLPGYGQQLGYAADPNIVYLFGGMTSKNKDINAIYRWNVTSNQYISLSITPPTAIFVTYSNNIVQISNTIYFVGTYDTKYAGSMYIFDVNTESWIDNSNISPLPYPAIYGCLTSNKTHLFFIGGQTDALTWLDQLQIYDIYRNLWFAEVIYVSHRAWIGWSAGYCQTVNDYLYIFGGEVDTDLHFINDIFKWHWVQGWSHIGYLPIAQGYGVAIRHYHYIYIIGGRVGSFSSIDTIYEFDTNLENIAHVYHMVHPLDSCAVGIMNNKLYLFGGWNDQEPNTVDAMDDVQICDILYNNKSLISTEPTTFNPTLSPATDQPTPVTISRVTSDPSISFSSTMHPTAYIAYNTTPRNQWIKANTSIPVATEQTIYKDDIVIKTSIGWKDNINDNDDFISKLIFLGIGSIIVGFCVGIIVISILCCCKMKQKRKVNVMYNIKYPSIHKFGVRNQNDHVSVSMERMRRKSSDIHQKMTETLTNNQQSEKQTKITVSVNNEEGKRTIEGLQGNEERIMCTINKQIREEQHITHNFQNRMDQEVTNDIPTSTTSSQ